MKKTFVLFAVINFVCSFIACSEEQTIQRQYSQTFWEHKSRDVISIPKNNSGSFQDVALNETQESSFITSKKSISCVEKFLSHFLCCCKTKPEKISEHSYQQHAEQDDGEK